MSPPSSPDTSGRGRRTGENRGEARRGVSPVGDRSRGAVASVVVLVTTVALVGLTVSVGVAGAGVTGETSVPPTSLAAGGGTTQPTATCSVSETTVAPGESVTLDATGSTEATAYRFDRVGDGSFGEYLDRPVLDVTYDEPGTYEPQVQVRSGDGATDTASCGTVTVESDNEPPTARLEIGVTTVAPGETLQFGSTSTDPDGEVVAQVWRVDGERVGEGFRFSYTFEEPGDHLVELTVTDDDGATDTDSVTITVESDNEPPTVEVGYSPAEPAPDEAVGFEASASDPDGEVTAYEWRVDGEVVGDGPTLEYAFPGPGEYTVAVAVTDDAGATATADRTVTVESEETTTPTGDVRVTASWRYAPTEPAAGDWVSLFADGPTDPRVTYRWTIEGERTATGYSVGYRFPGPGEYTVTLAATGPGGETATEAKTITVGAAQSGTGGEERPFRAIPSDPRPGQPVTFVADGVGAAGEYRWDLDGDGETDERGRVVTYVFPADTRVTVTLEAVTEDGRTTTGSTTVSTEGREPVARSERGRSSIVASPASPQPGDTVTFVATPDVPEEEVEEYRWDLDGDGETDERGRVVRYAFPEDGRVSVSLTVVGDDGDTTTTRRDVAVGNATLPDPTTSDGGEGGDGSGDKGDGDDGDDGGEGGDGEGGDGGEGDETTPDSDGGGGPGLGVVAALVALLAVVTLLARRAER